MRMWEQIQECKDELDSKYLLEGTVQPTAGGVPRPSVGRAPQHTYSAVHVQEWPD